MLVAVPSQLEAVTVHADGALCTRLASVQPVEGRLPTQVRLEGLPLTLNPGSLRARILQGPTGLVVRDVRAAYEVRLPPEEDVPATQRALEQAQQALEEIEAELERVQRELQSLRELRPAFPPQRKGQPPRPASPQALLALAELVDTESSALHARRLELERRQREARKELELRRRRLQESSTAARGQRALLYRAAVLTLSTPAQPGEVHLALEYAVRGATWVPGYELQLPRAMDGGTLRMRASVVQRTGEDWQGVKLSLSTAQLHRRADVPELKALRIGRRQPTPARSGWREPPPGLEELFAGYDAVAGQRLLAPPPPPVPPLLEQERKREKRRRSVTGEVPVGGAMPPPPASMPMPAAAAPPPPGAMADMVARPRLSPPPPAAAPALARMAPRAAARPAPKGASFGGGGAPVREEAEEDAPTLVADEGYGAPAEPPEPPRLEPREALMDYGRLELAAADRPGLRGKLQPVPERASRELLALAAVSIQVDVVALVAVQERNAASVQGLTPPSGAVPLRQSAPHFAYLFDVEPRADVPSNGSWHTVPVFSAPVGAQPEYVCVPSLEPLAFRTVRLENRTPHVLLAGPVEVTLGDEFLLTSPLPTLVPGGTQVLGLGVEEGLKVARNTRFEEGSGGVFGGATVLTHRVSVELANRLAHPVAVEVRERVPAVPQAEKDIKVEEAEVKPAWSKRTPPVGEAPVEGERTWRVTLQPGEKQALEARWVVKIPASKMLEGGNRRT